MGVTNKREAARLAEAAGINAARRPAVDGDQLRAADRPAIETGDSMSATQPASSFEGQPDSRTMLGLLFERACATLTDSELGYLTHAAGDTAANIARHASTVATGIAMLVQGDARGHHRAGSFTNAEDVSALLYLLADNLSHVEGLLHVASEAAAVRNDPQLRHAD